MSLDALTVERLQPVAERDTREHNGCYGNYRQGWIVVATHSQAERWANSNLRTRGYQTYLPIIAVRQRDRIIPSHWHTISKPLFPGYLFCWHDSRAPRRPIRETPGVRDIVRCGSETSFVAKGAVEALQALEAERATPHQRNARLAPGTPVAVSEGVFAGHPAVVLKAAADMALVSLMMFGQLREVAVSLDCLTHRNE